MTCTLAAVGPVVLRVVASARPAVPVPAETIASAATIVPATVVEVRHLLLPSVDVSVVTIASVAPTVRVTKWVGTVVVQGASVLPVLPVRVATIVNAVTIALAVAVPRRLLARVVNKGVDCLWRVRLSLLLVLVWAICWASVLKWRRHCCLH